MRKGFGDMNKKRYELLDTIRGLVLVSMIVYHASWNLVYIYGVKWPWYHSQGAYVWQQSICWTFILLSGFCFSLGKRPWRNGFLVFGSGVLVSLVTILIMPSNRVVFGVLTCIGSCMLILAGTKKFFGKVDCKVGMVISFLFFLITKKINAGYLLLPINCRLELPKAWYQNYVSTYLGFPFEQFYSTDYFSIIPWFFLFLTGYYLCRIFEKYHLFKLSIFHCGVQVFSYLGRHSLFIYLLHQPVIYGLQEIFFNIK